jgi:hypothetical protein
MTGYSKSERLGILLAFLIGVCVGLAELVCLSVMDRGEKEARFVTWWCRWQERRV